MGRCYPVHIKQLLPGFLLTVQLFLLLAISPPATALQLYGHIRPQISSVHDTLIPHLPRHSGITQHDIATNENDDQHSPASPSCPAYPTVATSQATGQVLPCGYASSTFDLHYTALYLLTQRIRL